MSLIMWDSSQPVVLKIQRKQNSILVHPGKAAVLNGPKDNLQWDLRWGAALCASLEISVSFGKILNGRQLPQRFFIDEDFPT